MEYKDAKERILAAQTLLLEPSSSFEKFSAVSKLLRGAHPDLDKVLTQAEKDLRSVEQLLGKDFFSFVGENLPEATEEQKKRKKAVLFFWKTWNTLRGEVARVQSEMNASKNSGDSIEKTSHWARVLSFAKGPFGMLTILALGFVATTSYTSVQIELLNKNCPTMIPSGAIPISIPGISFPTEPISAGKSAMLSMPGIPVTIQATDAKNVSVTSLKFSMKFQLGSVKSILLDGAELLGKTTYVNLYDKKSHTLVFACS